eukprot:COSAG02_NODE_2489_length_8698_cov_6.406443_3_plen_126_part_00
MKQGGTATLRAGKTGPMPRNTLRAVAVQLQAVPAAQQAEPQPPTVGNLKKDSKGRTALPSVPYTEELPGAHDVTVSAEEVAFFKENGFLVKRRVIDGEELCASCLASLLSLPVAGCGLIARCVGA